MSLAGPMKAVEDLTGPGVTELRSRLDTTIGA